MAACRGAPLAHAQAVTVHDALGHFGAVNTGNDSGQLIRENTTESNPAPVWTGVPLSPPAPIPQHGEATWMKVLKTESPRQVALDELRTGNTAVDPADPAQVETHEAICARIAAVNILVPSVAVAKNGSGTGTWTVTGGGTAFQPRQLLGLDRRLRRPGQPRQPEHRGRGQHRRHVQAAACRRQWRWRQRHGQRGAVGQPQPPRPVHRQRHQPRHAVQHHGRPGTLITLSATPLPGRAFTGWSSACSTQATKVCTLMMEESPFTKAYFAK